ncbi:hypothetical protein BCR35DRAFT_299585 [Leucosporidium creatinivorum]|uniref:F-box domain-containing protein n=1 Tax=Leucosporidium creatinivorum TaxID=106004 RepID=A0A1Y2G4H6_9BASI|nr:hypothetical protein BCR35DRAFT_299585 [Leucosporidium creatinivorum]
MADDNEVTVLADEVQSLTVSPEGQRASVTDQRLPDELLEMIAKETDFDDLKNLALANKWLSEACKPMLWRSVTVEGDFEKHEDKMVLLVSAGVGRYIRKIDYTQPQPLSKLSALHLSTFTGLEEVLLNLEAAADGEETGRDRHAVPHALSDALKRLSKLKYLHLERYGSFADTSFSLAHHLPQLDELLIPTFPYISADTDLPFIHPAPLALRRLEIGFDSFAAQGIASTAGTVKELLIGNRIFRDWDVEPLDYLEDLKEVFDSLVEGSKTSPWPLEKLWLAEFQMGSDPEHFEALLGLLSSLKHSSVWELKISGFMSFTYSTSNTAFSLPSITHLDLQAGTEDIDRCFLDEDTFISLSAFLLCFPNLQKLTLANWTFTLDPTEVLRLVRESKSELKTYWPLYKPLLGFLRTSTRITEVWFEQRRYNSPFDSFLKIGRRSNGAFYLQAYII